MFEELEVVELTHDIKENSLKAGDRGTVVEIYKNGEAYEVEFISPDGNTSVLLTLMPDDIRSTINKDQYLSHGFNTPEYVSTASGMTFPVDTGINKMKIGTETRKSKEDVKELRYPTATL